MVCVMLSDVDRGSFLVVRGGSQYEIAAITQMSTVTTGKRWFLEEDYSRQTIAHTAKEGEREGEVGESKSESDTSCGVPVPARAAARAVAC